MRSGRAVQGFKGAGKRRPELETALPACARPGADAREVQADGRARHPRLADVLKDVLECRCHELAWMPCSAGDDHHVEIAHWDHARDARGLA